MTAYTMVGEAVEYNGKSYLCKRSDATCYGCTFFKAESNGCKRPPYFGSCVADSRYDKGYVIFKEIEE